MEKRGVGKLEPDSSVVIHHYRFPDICQMKAHEVSDRALTMDEQDFAGIGREIAVEGIHLWYQSLKFAHQRTWQIRNDAPRVQMNFNLQGSTSFYSNKLEKVFVRFSTGQHNLILIPEGDIQMHWSADEHSEIFSLSLCTDFFQSLLPPSQRLSQHFQMGIEQRLPAFMSMRNLPVTAQMGRILFEILHCEYTGHHKSLFVKAKTVELLLLQMEQHEHLPLPSILSSLNSAHAEQMQLVKNILDENLGQQWSLKELARRVGTNEFNLKKYFKEVFGETVFGYLHQKRMETAKDELCQPGSSVNDIAQRMGYKHPTHFTAAFKKYHGILPSRLSKSNYSL
ncbi:helix-turn-helix transcriptional regulator [Dyadobacter fermentans]|uniref:Transcriptional regulator, AraC family n=1 Tax=Dyadobacter fermentans (strain ATCC 700827 / DSM 18053 / CIP 107007 / KCTC 52180 / NS114) TaxID=471854 RepID=C6VTG9_DYAFD|nr:AraC family transcriptional regulator [Dyadobacter fermentans]ACT92912.1 transcriptional regulator, AraC family [Dyadobacter fermentans DSM 18053]